MPIFIVKVTDWGRFLEIFLHHQLDLSNAIRYDQEICYEKQQNENNRVLLKLYKAKLQQAILNQGRLIRELDRYKSSYVYSNWIELTK